MLAVAAAIAPLCLVTAPAGAAAAHPAVPTTCSNPPDLWDVGNNAAAYIFGSSEVGFYDNTTGTLDPVCVVGVGTSEVMIFDGNGSGRCYAWNSTQKWVDEDSASACQKENTWDLWGTVLENGGLAVAFDNYYNSECLYDNTQKPAIVTSCAKIKTDTFFWFTT
jgi:hypothetical protein